MVDRGAIVQEPDRRERQEHHDGHRQAELRKDSDPQAWPPPDSAKSAGGPEPASAVSICARVRPGLVCGKVSYTSRASAHGARRRSAFCPAQCQALTLM